MARRHALAVACAAVAAAALARADIVLHEYLPPDAEEDLRLGATSAAGGLPAAIPTRGGQAVASPGAGPAGPRPAYGGEPRAADARRKMDGDTRRPESTSHHDPFSPTVAPFKRLRVFDAVDESFDLVVASAGLRGVPVGGRPTAADDQFYADLEVDLLAGTPVRVPSPGPDARLHALEVTPPLAVAFSRDGADNWFAVAPATVRARVVLHLSVERRAFGDSLSPAGWDQLARLLPRVPERVRTEGTAVARVLGVTQETASSEAVGLLVRAFRSFRPGADRLDERGAGLYREVVARREGVCRHRSWAFVVTALAVGLPARYVENEAHAWVEVHDARHWHRIDLGGAVGRVEDATPSTVAHVPPADPFDWPEGDEGAGRRAVERSRRGSPAPVAPTASPAPPPPPPDPEPGDDRPRSTVTLRIGTGETRRGVPLPVSGLVEVEGVGCGPALVELVAARPGRAERRVLGVVPVTGGRYEGTVTVPWDLPPGDYAVRAVTRGTADCGPGESE